VVVGDGQHIAVGVVSIADRAFGRGVARDSAHGIIEDLTDLTACIGDLLADVQLVVFVALCSFTKNSALVSKDGEKFFNMSEQCPVSL